MTQFNKETPLTLFGEKTPKTQIYKSESHKLCQAFCVEKDKVVVEGMPVALKDDGTITPYTGEAEQIYLGIAITNNVTPAYQGQRNFPVEVTVMVEGFCIVNWVAKETMDAGYVKPTDSLFTDRFVIAETSSDKTKFINLTPADEANDIISVLVK